MKPDRGGIVLEGIPMPPSSNHQYKSFVRFGRVIHVKSPELVQFKRAFDGWAFQNAKGLQVAQALCEGCAVEVEAFIGFKRSRVYTKVGGYKSLDVSNRLKALHDCLADKLGIDDKAFFSITAEKFCVSDDEEEQVIVRISPFNPREISEIQNVIL